MSKNRAEIYANEFETGVKLSYKHAISLIEAAEILESNGMSSQARFLAIQAEEEAGKALMLLDEIKISSPWITEKRWEKKYNDHEHKLRRAHLGIQQNVMKVTEWDVQIGPGSPKVVTEGEQTKKYAKYDVEKKFRSIYVNHELVRGTRQWITPLNPLILYSDSKAEIALAHASVRAVQLEAEKQGITL